MALTRVPRCVSCYQIVDVQLANGIALQDDGIRDGHYYAVYCREVARPFCVKCRHRIVAMERLIGMWQRRGDDVTWLGSPDANTAE